MRAPPAYDRTMAQGCARQPAPTKTGGADHCRPARKIVEYRPIGGGRAVAKRRHAIGSFDELTPEAARKAASGLLAGVRLGGDPAGDRADTRDAISLKALSELFFAEHVDAKRKASTAEDYHRLLNLHILPELGAKKAAAITEAGHANTATTQRYAHLDNDPLRKAANRIGGDIAATMGEPPPKCRSGNYRNVPQRFRRDGHKRNHVDSIAC